MKKQIIIVLLIVFICPFIETNGQYLTNWLNIGSYHNWFSEIGAEVEHGNKAVQQFGARWPAEYRYQDMQCAKALWIGTTNFFEREQVRAHKVVHVGPRVTGTGEFYPVDFKLYSKYEIPRITADGSNSIPEDDIEFDDNNVNPNILGDRMIYNEVNNELGITVKRRIFKFNQQYHDNYIVSEYTFVNTGNANSDPSIEFPDRTLTDVMFYFQYRISVNRQVRYIVDNSAGWGVNTVLDARGERVEDGRYEGDNPLGLRFQFAFHGKHGLFSKGWDNTGMPIIDRSGDVSPYYVPRADTVGRLGAAQFWGIMTLFASDAPNSMTDDETQPRTTRYISSDDAMNYNNDHRNYSRGTTEYNMMITGHPSKRHINMIEGDGYLPTLYAEPKGIPSTGSSNAAGYSIANGYGPYTLAHGDSVRIVMVEAVAGLSWDSCISIGKKYKNFIRKIEGAPQYNHREKNLLFLTGKDSLIQTFTRAKAAYDNNWNIPQAPLPPKSFSATSAGGRIDLAWDLDPNTPAVAGFEIYRSISEPMLEDGYAPGRYDTKYELVATLGPSERSFKDSVNISKNFDYFYYIQCLGAASDNNNPTINPTGVLKSHRLAAQTFNPVQVLPEGKSKLEGIVRVVPNPYISNSEFRYTDRDNKLVFMNIPGECTIDIYTEIGEKIESIDHTNGSGSHMWYMTTYSNQIIVSGIYIAVVTDTKTGDKELVKFVVIR